MLKDFFVKFLNRIDFVKQAFFTRENIKKVLVVKLCCMGDIIQITPSLRALYNEGKEVHFLCNPWVKDVVDAIPYIKKKYIIDFRDIGGVLKVLSELRAEKYDLIINFHRDLILNLFILFAGARYRAGFNWKGEGIFLTSKFEYDPKIHEVERYLSIIDKLGFKIADDYTYIERPDAGDEKYTIEGKRIKIGVFPGGGKNPGTVMPTKRWPVENFIRLADILEKKGNDVYIFGGETDGDVTEQIKKAKPNAKFIITPIKEFMHYASLMDVFVGGDTGPVHIVSAMGIRTIGIFGPSSPEIFGAKGKNVYNIFKAIDCSPCYEPGTVHYRKFLKCKNNICMKQITPEEVNAVIDEILEKGGKS